MSRTPEWLEKALATAAYHRSQQLSHSNKWTIHQTRKALKRSFGSVAEDLLIARESRMYNLEQFEYAFEALNFIRLKKKERELDD